ncbi:hypothetical protein CYMTET_34982, partial [Cymbomonas tetramitiformis]
AQGQADSTHTALVEWIWKYFTAGEPAELGKSYVATSKPPLYFQHQGHSRTVVGIERRRRSGSAADEAILLILDPSQARHIGPRRSMPHRVLRPDFKLQPSFDASVQPDGHCAVWVPAELGKPERTKDLARALRSQSKWQPLLKRGVHTLRKAEYQLVYVAEGVVGEPKELAQLKTIAADEYFCNQDLQPRT